MKHLINEEYSKWLKKYKKQARDNTTLRIAQELINALPTRTSVKALIDLLAPHTTDHPEAEQEEPFLVYGPINFYATLLHWNNYLHKVEEKHQKAIKLLAGTANNPKTASLLFVLKQLMNEPIVLLNSHILKLLNLICDDSFYKMLRIISGLQSPKGQLIKPQTQFQTVQENVVALLNAHRASIEEDRPIWHSINNLLELALHLYKEDMHLVEIDLADDEEEESIKPQVKESLCIIV